MIGHILLQMGVNGKTYYEAFFGDIFCKMDNMYTSAGGGELFN